MVKRESQVPGFRVNISVNDFPLLVPLGVHLQRLKEAGVDGIELAPGYKSRFNLKRVKELTDKSGLSFDSIHQPFWSVAGWIFDERLVQEAAVLGVKTFVFHPPARVSFEDKKMKRFLKRLVRLQERYNIQALIENMPWAVRPKLLRQHLPFHTDTSNLAKLGEEVSKHGLGLTFDTSHAFIPAPQTQDWFNRVYPLIRNIHLSSFIEGKDHLPLNMGNLDTKGFVAELRRLRYKSLITLEVNYPRMMRVSSYDYGAIADSVYAVKNHPSKV